MIGSTLSRMAAAEKLSIPQLQQAIQNGTIPAYVGIPLLQEKVKMEQRMKMSAAGSQQGTPPTVADQVMQEATAEEMQNRMSQGVDQLPVEAPAMASGGIVAFADGGDTEDEEEYEDRQEASAFARRMAMGDASHENLMSRLKALGQQGANMSNADVSGGQLAAGQKVGAYKGISGDHKYSDLIRSEAKKVGLDPEYALKIAMIETGGLKNPESARSKAGAIGIMQLMPATAKGLGVDPTDPEQNVRGGVSMLKRLVDKYGDYQLAGAAYNAGEGRVDRALKSGNLAGLPGETQGYMGKIRGMKEGGIAHFYDGGVTTYDPVTGEPYTEEGTTGATADILNFFKRSAQQARGIPDGSSGIGLPAAMQKGASPRALENKSMSQFKAVEPTLPRGIVKKEPPTPAIAPETKPTVVQEPPAQKENIFDQWMREQLASREGKRAEQADQDKWLSVLAAGLGMMGGTSQYAAANIGQGAMAGVSNYAQARKQAAKEEAAQEQNILMAQHYKGQEAAAAAQLAANKEHRKDELAVRQANQATIALDKAQDNYKEFKKNALSELAARFPAGAMTKGYQQAYDKIFSSPEAIELAKRAQMPIPTSTIAAGTLKFDARGNPIQ